MEQCYISAGCNRTPHSADWGSGGLICYATHNSVALYQPEYNGKEAEILTTVTGHKNRVNCVSWIKSTDVTQVCSSFVSGSVDCTVVVWQQDGQGKYKPMSTLKGHTGPVNSVTAIKTSSSNGQSDDCIYVASSSADSTVNIWKKYQKDEVQNVPDGRYTFPEITSGPIPSEVNFTDGNIVVFDLETTGLGDAEIVQISAKHGACTYNEYVLPTKPINPSASAITNIYFKDGKLYHKGETVNAKTKKECFEEFLKWLPGNSILVAHNCKNFDSKILVKQFLSVELLESLKSKVLGFSDTLPLYRDMYPGRRSYKQTDLVGDLLRENYDAHNSSADVDWLFRLMEYSQVTIDQLQRFGFNIEFVFAYLDYTDRKNECKETFNCLKEREIMTQYMIDKAAGSGLVFEDFNRAFKRGGAKLLVELLSQKGKDGKPRVTEDKKIQSHIIEYFKTSLAGVQGHTEKNEFSLMQTLKFGTGFILDLVATVIPGTNVTVLACGCDDHKIHIYVEEKDQFVKVLSLPGHEDWIRALDFTTDDGGDLLLASAAQDNFIRIWRMTQQQPGTDIIKAVKELSLEEEIKIKGNTFKFRHKDEDVLFSVSLESVLHGHENWIYSIKWQPKIITDSCHQHQPMRLLSASMDKTMILWKPDPDSGVWVEEVRVGEVGGNTLGLYGGMFSPDGKAIMAHGYQGAFHQWTFCQKSNSWRPVVTVSGHFDEVQDLDWDRGDGQFVISVGSDQTSRLHAPCVSTNRKTLWYEIARPQVHGYDMQCLGVIHRYMFASGADEKVVRMFEAPKNFIDNFCQICGVDFDAEMKKEEAQNRPEGASVPALGLSNKAVSSGQVVTNTSDIQQHPNDQYPEVYFTAVTLKEPPTEEHLLQNTLWPETQKLYGHGYEIFALASDPSGTILASSCKAAKAEFAGVILWDTSSWRQVQTLEGHSLTVTQLSFSHNGQYLLSVSRDRTWCLYKKRKTDQSAKSVYLYSADSAERLFSRIAYTDKQSSVHSRIIWSCAWSHDDQYFFTASRDKKILVWPRSDLQKEQVELPPKPIAKLEVEDSATAIDTAPVSVKDNRYLVSVGLENGGILLYIWTPGDRGDNSQWNLVNADKQYYHSETIKRLKFRPVTGIAGQSANKNRSLNNYLQLASCSTDHSVRIFSIDLNKL